MAGGGVGVEVGVGVGVVVGVISVGVNVGIGVREAVGVRDGVMVADEVEVGVAVPTARVRAWPSVAVRSDVDVGGGGSSWGEVKRITT